MPCCRLEANQLLGVCLDCGSGAVNVTESITDFLAEYWAPVVIMAAILYGSVHFVWWAICGFRIVS